MIPPPLGFTCSCSTFRIQSSQVAPSSCWDLLRSTLLQFAGDKVPSPLGRRGAHYTITQTLSTREQGSQEPPSPGPGPLASVGPWASCPHPLIPTQQQQLLEGDLCGCLWAFVKKRGRVFFRKEEKHLLRFYCAADTFANITSTQLLALEGTFALKVMVRMN